MKYKLAKQLKDVGFPFMTSTIKNGIGEIKLAIPTTERVVKYLDTSQDIVCFGEGYKKEWFFVPDLEELIDACEKDGLGAFTLRCDVSRHDWVATLIIMGGDVLVGEGETPLEAVAKLYIKLNT